MAEFSGKVVSAQFIDAEYSIIKVLYDNDGTLTVYNLDVNPDHPDFKDLLADGWSLDRIIEETAESKRAQSAAWNLQVNAAATALVNELIIKQSETLSDFEKLSLIRLNSLNNDNNNEYKKRKNADEYDQEIYNFIMNKNSDKDELFKFKLWALELDFVKDKDKETKLKLRKVQTILDGLSMLNELK